MNPPSICRHIKYILEPSDITFQDTDLGNRNGRYMARVPCFGGPRGHMTDTFGSARALRPRTCGNTYSNNPTHLGSLK